VLHRLVDRGNTVVVIEHELDLVKNADRIVDLGPEGGDDGGRIVAEGTPEAVARTEGSYTGEYLRDLLPAIDLEGPRSDRELASPDGDPEDLKAAAGDD
jgi:excinuclease ABC subunit A